MRMPSCSSSNLPSLHHSPSSAAYRQIKNSQVPAGSSRTPPAATICGVALTAHVQIASTPPFLIEEDLCNIRRIAPYMYSSSFFLFFFKDKSVSIHSDNKQPAAAAHSLPAQLGTNTNSPHYQMEAAVIETLSSAPALLQNSAMHTPPPPPPLPLTHKPVIFYQTLGGSQRFSPSLSTFTSV